MAGQASVLDDNFVVNQATGITRYTAVVQDPNPHEISNPSGAGAAKFIGIAQEDQDNGLTANVRMLGNTFVRAVGAIPVGAPLVIGDVNGYVDAASNVAGAQQIIGYAIESATANGDIILMAIASNVRQEKKITGTTNATAGTQNSYPHSLGYAPTKVLLTARGNGVVYESAAADATNIYVEASAASINFDAYVE